MKVIAEGLKRRSIGISFPLQCEMVQGFHFYHPCNGETMKRLLIEKQDLISEFRLKKNSPPGI
jgi:EAL domain-containing protein (putative c-di-GMP-specific phosphodiesterase class I)